MKKIKKNTLLKTEIKDLKNEIILPIKLINFYVTKKIRHDSLGQTLITEHKGL